MKSAFVAVLGAILIAASAAEAVACAKVSFSPARNPGETVHARATIRTYCQASYLSLRTTAFTSATAAQRPKNGTLTIQGIGFRYVPRKGFKGTDQFAIKVCGQDGAHKGCSTIVYSLTVQ